MQGAPVNQGGALVVSIITCGSYNRSSIFRVMKPKSTSWQRSAPGRAEGKWGSGAGGRGGRSMSGRQAHLCFPGNRSHQSIPYWEMEMPACAYMVTLRPIYSTAEQLALVNKVSPMRGHSSLQNVSTGGSLGDPTEHTEALSGVHNGPSQERALTSPLRKKLTLTQCFPEQILPWNFFFKDYPLCLPEHL